MESVGSEGNTLGIPWNTLNHDGLSPDSQIQKSTHRAAHQLMALGRCFSVGSTRKLHMLLRRQINLQDLTLAGILHGD